MRVQERRTKIHSKGQPIMTTEDIIISVFCLVDDQMQEVPKQRQAKLYPSELVTIGLLFALIGHGCNGRWSSIRTGTSVSWQIPAFSWSLIAIRSNCCFPFEKVVVRSSLSTMRKQGRPMLAAMAAVFRRSPFPIAWEPGTE